MKKQLKKEVVCECDYSWKTSTKLDLVTCPSCGKKTKVEKGEGK